MKDKKLYLLSIFSLILGILLMHFLVRVYFVGIILLFILIAFQTPSQKVDQTGEVNDASIKMLRLIGLNAILYLAGGYIAAIWL